MTDVATELAEAIIGALFVTIGAAAAAAGATARPKRNPTPIWFGVFCLLYGCRLAVKSELVQMVVGWDPAVFAHVDAAVTYAILVPAGLFVESLVGPGWHGLIRRSWQFTCLYAIAAIAWDLAHRPYAAMSLNPPIVLATLTIQTAHFAALLRRGRWAADVRAVMAAGVAAAAVAIYETWFEKSLLGNGVDVEPFTMLLFTGTLAWFVFRRGREQAYGFVALSRELELARTIQQSLLPQHMPGVAGVRVNAACLPMSAIGGDFYDVVGAPDGRLTAIVADVSGHGVPAALVASMVKVAFATEAERSTRPGDILCGINRALTGKFERAYVTACCAVVTPAEQSLAYAAAGHPPGMLRRADGALERLRAGGIILTMLPDATYETEQLPFRPGDRLLMFTDGLLEAARGDDEFFGDAELGRVVSALPAGADVSAVVLAAHRAWIGPEAPLPDDVTLVVVEAIGNGHERAPASDPPDGS